GEVPGRLEDLVTLPGVGRKTAETVAAALAGAAPAAPAVNTATGEIIEDEAAGAASSNGGTRP
ncbi:hypothetical protein, partial [Streptomyces rhizosphaericus]|uniref:hypothetical protein n=1 Tax=Streptomyces rhizosphaericus TaxID=114699 RepID=UPI0031DB13AB